MKLIPSAAMVRQSLAGHSWLGLLTAALMYLVCLTGVPVVFMHELGRWEQPRAEESQAFEPAMLDRAWQGIRAAHPDYQGSVVFNLPVWDKPRLTVNAGDDYYLTQEDGSLNEVLEQPFIEQLIGLHVHLHMPRTIGVVIVGVLGALLCGLIVSGVFAHPRIFRDAFKWRTAGSARLAQVDLHNRLSVWNLPFQLLIAISGAFFGVYNFALLAIAFVHAEGNPGQVLGEIYGQGPQIVQAVDRPDFSRALAGLHELDPQAVPFQVAVENAGTDNQYLLLSAKHPHRLIYAEEYYFAADGSYLEKHGFSDGPVGRQVLFSIHSLHLGDYGGLGIKLLYAVLGLAMAVVSATGVNIWLQRRNRQDWINVAWPAVVWGTPLALVASAIGQVILRLPAAPAFWFALMTCLVFCLVSGNETRPRSQLQGCTAVLIVLLLLAYTVRFGSASLYPLPVVINLLLLALATLLGWLASKCAFRPIP